MLRTKILASLTLAALGCSAAALADESANHGMGVTAGITGGTNGLGLEAGYRFSDHIGVRANYTGFNYNKTFDSDDFDTEGKIKLKSFGGMLDVYPMGGSFRVSVGLRSNKNQFGGVATPNTATVDVGDDTYTQAQVGDLTGTAKFKKVAPTVTLGWGGHFTTGLHFGFEVGVVAQGSPKLSASSSGTLKDDPTFQASLNDQLDKWEDNSSGFKLWPVIQLHLSYSF